MMLAQKAREERAAREKRSGIMPPSLHGPMEIVCGIDSVYAPHLGVMLTSLVATNPAQPIRVHVLHDGIDPALRARVAACVPSIQIEWKEIADHRVLNFDTILHITRATYLRLTMLEALDPEIKRILYLDVDMIVNGDLRPLWDINLGDKVCAAVVDPGAVPEEFAAKWSLATPGQYFNAGVMLFDLDRLREKPFLQRAADILANPATPCEYADQDALNIVLWNEWLPVDPGWNFQRKFLYDNFTAWKALAPMQREPAIIHYTERYKPWRRSEWHPYAWLYLKNLSRTPFREQVLEAGEISFRDRCKWWLRWLLKRPPIFREHRV
jgi:lipopolysaccharide biosynthesis glycosyltransferase